MNVSRGIRRGAWLLALLLPFAAAAHDTPQPIANTEGGSQVVAVTAGGYHSCGVKADGSVACWGDNVYGQATAPAGKFLSVSTGLFHSCGVKADGSVACWGGNGDGQTTAPAGAFLSVLAGDYHNCGVRTDGSVACWGSNYYGQTNAPAGAFLSVSAGFYHSCGVKADGSVACWGSNDYGQANAPTGAFLSVSTGGLHSCGVQVDGSVACWGSNGLGQATAPADAFLSVSAGYIHSCGVKADGSVACWGSNGDGQATAPAGKFLSVSAGSLHSCGVKADGGVACWGDNGDGQSTVPADLGPLGFGQIAAGNAHACQVTRDGTLSCWGSDDEGQATPPEGLFTQVVAGSGYGCGIRADGKATCWGRTQGAGFFNFSLGLYSGTYKQLALGVQHRVCALATSSSQTTWCINESTGSGSPHSARRITSDYSVGGNSLCGVRGNGQGYCSTPQGTATAADAIIPDGLWQRLESGLGHQCGLKADGTLQCWGDNSDGQTTGVPEGVIRSFSVGWNHACAIKGDGTLACWGSNVNGQTDAPAGTYVQVAAGNTFTCAIRSDGVRLCWGDDSHGQAPQLQLAPVSVADGVAGTAHAGATFALADASASANPLQPYAPVTPAFAVVDGSLPDGLTLDADGSLHGTLTTPGSFSFTVEGEDANGFTASREYTIAIADGTAPAIAYTLDPATANGTGGWYVTDVGIDWTVTEPESPGTLVLTGCVDATLATDTSPAGQTFSCAASSAGGSAGPVEVVLKRDATAPTIEVAPATPANADGWHNADVTVLVACADATPGSGVASCPSVASVTAEGTTTVPAQTVTDNAGNSADSDALTVRLDKTAPTIVAAASPATPDGDNGWYRSPVEVAFTCNDALSGVVACPVAQTLATDGSAVASSAHAIQDLAGNGATSNVVIVKIDQTAPTLAPSVPDPLLRGQGYSASPNASDATSGVATASCGPLDTSTLGTRSVECIASDNAGNSATESLAYTVTTTCANDGYTGTQLNWCRNICEMGYSGSTLNMWLRRWKDRYHDDGPYCMTAPPPPAAD